MPRYIPSTIVEISDDGRRREISMQTLYDMITEADRELTAAKQRMRSELKRAGIELQPDETFSGALTKLVDLYLSTK